MTSRSYKSNGNSNHHNPRSLNKATIGDFRIGTKLGQGTFSTVCQGTHIPTGEKVAIKIMSKDQIKEKSDKIRIEKEINIQKKLHHQNIVQQYAILETDSTIYIISEYCSGGELFDYIVSKRKLYEVEACRIYQQLISGLEYLHKQRICHRDLKPENLLFDSKHNLKIADFGLSNDYHKGKLSTPCGSPCYAAPEMVTGKRYNGSSVDIWSSGIVLYTMVCGFLPFEDDNQNILFGKIAKGLFSLPSFLSQSCKDLLKKILVTDPKRRYGFEEIKHHSWFMSVNNVMGKNILFNSPGVFVDEDVLPIDVEIVAEIFNDFHIDITKIVNDVLRNRHNKITTTYYLILKRKIRNNESSISDISSNSTYFIKYIKSSISKMGYWDNDYEKITAHYVKLVKKFLNSISEEENSMSTDSRHKINSKRKIPNNGNNTQNKVHHNNNSALKTEEVNKEKNNLKKLSNTNTNNPTDYRVYTEMNDSLASNKNKNAKNKVNNISNDVSKKASLNNTVQNGGIDLRINTFYDERNTVSTKPYVETKNDIEEPISQKVNDSYKPKKSIQEFLQTDANNIKMNERLFKNTVELNNEKNYNKLNNNNNNVNILKSEESTNKEVNKIYNEQKETTLPTVERILLTEVNNIGINSLQNNLLNKDKNFNVDKNDINNNFSKDMQNDSFRNERMNTLYNKDDSEEKLNTLKNENNTINDNFIETESNKINNNENIKRNSLNKKEYNNKDNYNNSKSINSDVSKAINGLNEHNYNNNNKNRSVEKLNDDSNKINNNNITNKNYNNNNNKDKGNKFLLNVPNNNQIHKKLSTYSEKQERIMKFINQKNSSIPKTKEDSKRESTNYNLDLDNGKFLYSNINKYKYKNRYSQESNFANKYINNIIMNGNIKPNGSNEISYINKIMYGNNNDAMYTKKKKRPKSIDDKDYRINKKFYIKESNKINNSFNKKDNNNDFYSKNKNSNQRAIYNDKKYLDESYFNSFRFNNMNYIQNMKYNKKRDIPDFNNTSHSISRANNNYFIEKMINKEKYNALFNKNLNNYTNLSINKNHKLHEHNSFDLPKNIKNKLKKNRFNSSMEKINKNQNNNNNIMYQYNKNINNLNKKKNYYYRNTSNKPNSSITQYCGINNYNFDKYGKFSNEKMLINQNQRMINYKGNKFKSNSVDMNSSKNNNFNPKSKNKRKFHLNTSVIKDKTPKKLLFTSLFPDKNRHNYAQYKKNFILNTLENTYTNSSNANNLFKNNKEDLRYLTLRDNDSLSSSSRKNKFHNYFLPKHKRYNFSQEPEKKRKDSEALDIFSPFGKGNSFIVSNSKKNNFLFNNKEKKIHKFGFPNLKNLSQFNKNVIYEKQLFITNSNNKDIKINGKNVNNNMNNNNIMCRKSIDKIKEIVEKIVGHKVNLISIKNPPIKNLECKYIEGANIINFILNINKSSGQKDYVTITPTLIVGNENTYKQVIEKIKNKLI